MVATLAVAMIVVGLVLLMITALLLNRSYDALVASQTRTRDIIAHASDGIFIADLAGRYLEVNSAGCQLLGVSEDEIVGRSIRDFILPDEAERLAHAREELLRGASQTAEWHLRHRSGRYIPVEVSTKILPGGMWEGLVRDISRRKAAEEQARRELTERQRLEQQLREARSFLENVLQSSVEYGLIALDLDRRILFWNEGARRMFGYSTQEMVGASADALHVTSDITSGEAPALYARALDEGSAEATQRRRRRDGSEFLSRVMVTRRTSADGTPSGYLLVSRDVTREHREAEHDRLLASIGLLLTSSLDRRQVVAGTADLLVREFADACVVDIADRPEADVQAWTSSVAHRDSRMKPLTSALEKIRRDGVHPYFAVAPLEARRTTLVSHVTDEFLDSLARSDEHRHLLQELSPASLISVPLQARGLLLGVITFVSADPKRRYDEADAAFVEEIGQRLALALDNARLFEAATHAIAARDDVMRVVAHDLRNPLSTILMQASSLRSKEPESEGSPGRGESIERAARRMNRLIQDLLDVTRLETGRLSVKQAPESARAIVADSVEAQRELAAKASLELRADVPPELPNVWADRDRLLQVFENLIGNSTKFTRPGGQIVAGAAPHDGEVLFWVRDTGRGIPAEDLPHVFDRFWQTRRDGGTGLGLPIVKGLVEAQGGRVWAESASGHGSTFYFTVPMTRSAKPTRDRRRSTGSRKARR
jgi:PAS domain S-box-containing protein